MAKVDDECVIRAIGCILKQLCDRSDSSTDDPDTFKSFVALQLPSISILDYAKRLQKYMCCSDACFVIAMVYIDRLIQKGSRIIIHPLTIHRLLFVAVVCACKFWDDEFYKNSFYARVGGVSVRELNRLELDILLELDFDLHVNPNTYSQYRLELTKHIDQNRCVNCADPDTTPISTVAPSPTASTLNPTAPAFVPSYDHQPPSQPEPRTEALPEPQSEPAREIQLQSEPVQEIQLPVYKYDAFGFDTSAFAQLQPESPPSGSGGAKRKHSEGWADGKELKKHSPARGDCAHSFAAQHDLLVAVKEATQFLSSSPYIGHLTGTAFSTADSTSSKPTLCESGSQDDFSFHFQQNTEGWNVVTASLNASLNSSHDAHDTLHHEEWDVAGRLAAIGVGTQRNNLDDLRQGVLTNWVF